MDIQKEREAFEIEFSKIKSDISFWVNTWDEDMQGYNHPVMCWIWHIWQASKAQSDKKIKLLLCDEHLQKCESPTGIFNSQYPDEEPCLICLAKQAKAQAVPEWIEYEKQSPRIDGRYQIFINGEQLAADWESPYGFSSAEDGTAFIQELITHWSVLNNDPVVKAQEQSHESK